MRKPTAARFFLLGLCVACLSMIGQVLYAQTPVKGTVTDASGEPLIGAGVLVAGTTQGTTTDLDGHYEIICGPNAVLEFSYIGMGTQAIPVQGRALIDVVLEEDTDVLNEVVVTALGIRRASKALSYNVQKVDSGHLTTVKSTNVMSSLAGKVAGVNINTSSAGVGGATRVVMRGPKSINQSNSALYVIDGVPVNNRNNGEVSNGIFSTQPGSEGIADLNPEDIESISVLSGPAAAALYGNSAAQGVIMITTKKGQAGKVSVTIANNTSFSSPFVLPEFQNSYVNSLGQVKSWGARQDTDYQPAKFFQTGANVQNSVALTAGNEKNQTYLSFGTTNADGIIRNNKYDRYNAAFRNTTTMLDNRLTLDFSFNYIREHDQNLMAQGQYFNPLPALYLFPRGESFDAIRTFEIWDPSRRIYAQNWNYGNALSMQNPFWITDRMVRSNDKDRYMVAGSLKYQPLQWLDFTGRVRFDDAETKSQDKRYATTNNLFTGGSDYGFYGYSKISDKNVYGDLMANINQTWDHWSLSANLGTSFSYSVYDQGGYQGGLRNLSNDFSPFNIRYEYATNDNRPVYAYTRHLSEAVFANVELGWNSMVYLTLTGRNDWDSALANTRSMKKGFFYPSVGLSAILSQMMQLPQWWNYLKVRASYANVGSPIPTQISSPYRYTYTPASQLYQTNTYAFPEDFKPEKTNSYEVGVSSQFFGGDLGFEFTWYRSNTFNQTFLRGISAAGANSSEYYQAGNIQNEGIELAVNVNKKWGGFGWNSGFTYSMNRNKIIELYADNPEEIVSKGGLSGISVVLKQGGTMGDIYSYTDFKRDPEGNIALDANGNIIRASLTNPLYKGSVLPKGNFGWNNEFTFAGVNLGFLLTARLGGIVMSQTQAVLDEYGVSKASAVARDNGGIPVNTGILDAEKYYSVVGGENPIWSEYIYDGTNVRLQEAHLGYNFPSKWLHGKQLYIGLTANNLLMIFNHAPFDPESTASTGTYFQGFDYFMQPSLRTFGFNVRLKL